MTKRLMIISNDIPWPANSGGRVDVWRRLNAIRGMGIEVSLLCWYDAGRNETLKEDVVRKIRSVCEHVQFIPIRRTPTEILARTAVLWRLPSHVASRWVTINSKSLLNWAREIGPSAILLDGLYGAEIAKSIAYRESIPLLYRSHNVEHEYMRLQFHLARSWKKRLGLAANLFGLKRYEKSILTDAHRVFDISIDDLDYWKSQGIDAIDWLPPLVDESFCGKLNLPADKSIDVLYFGNLHTPNNVDSLRWLIREILPRVQNREIRVSIAGSNPTNEVMSLVKEDCRVRLHPSPEDMGHLISAARVIVNPMLAGSGVNLKSVEMLHTGAELISTSVGVAGLPADVKSCFQIADTAIEFSEMIARSLTLPGQNLGPRASARRYFSPMSIASTIANYVAETSRPSGTGLRSSV